MVNRSGLRQVPWQSWEQWQWVADGIFSKCSDRIVAAHNRIKAWQGRGHVPISVETTSALTSVQQRDPHFNPGLCSEDVLPEDMLRMMYAMTLQRLVNGVVDVSAKRNSSSVASRAESAGFPRLLVDIRHETAHNELPGLPLLRTASEQALEWLKDRYWEPQRQALGNVRQDLKKKLLEHCELVVNILTPMTKPDEESTDEDEDEGERKSRHRLVMRTVRTTYKRNLKLMKQERVQLFKDLEDLCVISSSELVSILVDDGLLERGLLPGQRQEEKAQPESDDSASDTQPFDLEAAMYTAWRYTICRLTHKIPRLPDMLLVAIVKRIGSSRRPDPVEDGNELDASSAGLNRLIAWCAWLLDSDALEAPLVSVSQDAIKSKTLGISRKLSVKAKLTDELCRELLRSCLRLSIEKGTLDELVSVIALKAGNKDLQQKALALARFGSISSRASGPSDKTTGTKDRESEARPMEEAAQGPAAGGEASEATAAPKKLARISDPVGVGGVSYEKVKKLQSELLVRMASKGLDSSRTLPGNNEERGGSRDAAGGAASSRAYTDAGPQGRKWTVAQSWRPCAIGMIPSPYSVVGVLPSLDLPQTPVVKRQVQAETRRMEQQVETSEDTVRNRPADSQATATMEVNGKRKAEVESSSPSGEKRAKNGGNRVRFSLVNGENGRPSNSRQATVRKLEQGRRLELIPSGGSLLQGCIRQHGQVMHVSSQQLDLVKAAVHVL
ncbi:hypothetical protein R1sor_014726 [Riccia sorocarpa]|uniref:LAS1 n=1 Tax=Riccia sorocarpa TaxID=122646 RepID=A0ABD3HCU1_9MARC